MAKLRKQKPARGPQAAATAEDFAAHSRSETLFSRMLAVRTPRLLRGLEFSLLLFALALGAGAIMLIDLSISQNLSAAMLVPGIIYGAITIGLHLVVRLVAPNADALILPLATLLNVIGIAMIYRIDLAAGPVDFNSTSIRQIMWAVLAMVLAGVLMLTLKNHRVLLQYIYLFGALGIVLLLLPLVPGLGFEAGGARQWIHIGPYSFQPVEIAKIALAIFFAGYLMQNRDALALVGRKIGPILLPRGRDLGPLIVVWAVAMGVLVFQRELGTSVLLLGLFLAMLYVATGRASWVLLGVTLFAAGGYAAYRTLPYVQARFDNWLDPFRDAHGASFQLVQGLFGMANGGVGGTGLGGGYPQLTPLADSDYIVASLAEELGFVGVVAVLLAYLLLIARGLRVAFSGHDDFGRLLAAGLAFTLALQIFVVIGGVTRVIPLTGLTSPFLAAGGSSLVSNWLIVALFLLMSNSVRSQSKLVIRT
ncbi:MAG: FtsW/RodA/SpoVE family cell cycle protein [Microbacteriaceae bacterium]|nr:FtsW/RodA/SpoVE family cell cycle protein [Microbacteriaceae bacterium]